jgi:hypothetical protein
MDIVERLRSVTRLLRETEETSYEQDDTLAKEAADEIERLREALTEADKALVAWMGENSPIRNVLQDYIKTALNGDE